MAILYIYSYISLVVDFIPLYCWLLMFVLFLLSVAFINPKYIHNMEICANVRRSDEKKTHTQRTGRECVLRAKKEQHNNGQIWANDVSKNRAENYEKKSNFCSFFKEFLTLVLLYCHAAPLVGLYFKIEHKCKRAPQRMKQSKHFAE